MEVLADAREMRIDPFLHGLRHSGVLEGLLQPREAPFRAGHKLQMPGFGLVHQQLRAGKPEQLERKTHVIGMHMRKEDLADIGSVQSKSIHPLLERGERGVRFHAAVDKEVPAGEAQQKYIDRLKLERKRQLNCVNAGKHLGWQVQDWT